MKARKGLYKRPGWGNVYNYGVMHTDYQELPYDEDEPSENESFMADCKVFYDFVYALDSSNDDDSNDDY